MISNKNTIFLALTAIQTATVSSCMDSSTYTFGSFQYNGETVTRTCAWITQNASLVADRQANWCNEPINGSIVKEECQVACNSCPIEGPTANPTMAPVVPTQSPTRPPSPAFSCVDSLLRLKILDTDGSRISRSCEWVARRATLQRCALPGVSAACPVTCGTCSTCVDPEAPMRFKFSKDGVDTIIRDCGWVAARSTNMRCGYSENICRSTCGRC